MSAENAGMAAEEAGRPNPNNAKGESDILLALSGGGYRAMLFHVGALWGLNELGLLPRVTHLSGVSGGAIVAGVLGAAWNDLNFDPGTKVSPCFRQLVAEPLMTLATHTIDRRAVILGALSPFESMGEVLERTYARYLFGDRTLSHLPGHPTFYINATNLQTGAVWVFSQDHMGDDSIGKIYFRAPNDGGVRPIPSVRIATAVAASSAYPPFFSPIVLEIDPTAWDDPDTQTRVEGLTEAWELKAKDREMYRSSLFLADGGILDNLGMEALWAHKERHVNTELYVSDGGGIVGPDPEPQLHWIGQTFRVIGLIHGLPTELRTKFLTNHDGRGRYWSIHGWTVPNWGSPSERLIKEEELNALARMPTRLGALDDLSICQPVNWGYLVTSHTLQDLKQMEGLPIKTMEGSCHWGEAPLEPER